MPRQGAAVTITGGRDTRRRIRAVSDDARTELRSAHLEAATVVARQARFEVPVRTGALEATIRAMATQTKGTVRAGRARVPYAGPVHFGWPTRPNPAKGWFGGPIRPQPFIYEAADRRIGQVVDAYNGRLGEIIRSHDLD